MTHPPFNPALACAIATREIREQVREKQASPTTEALQMVAAAASRQHAFDATAARDYFNEADEAQSVEWFIELEQHTTGELRYLQACDYSSRSQLSRAYLSLCETVWSFTAIRGRALTITGTRRAHAIAEFLRAMHPGWSVRVTTTGGI